MKRISISFLKVVIVLIGMVTLALLLWLPLTEGRATNLDLIDIYTNKFVLYAYMSSIPFFVALYKAFRLLGYIVQNKAFSTKAVNALRYIKFCAILLSALVVAAGLFVMITHKKEEDPAGFIAICILITFVSVVIATATAVFERLLQNAVDNMNSENSKSYSNLF